MSFIWRVVCMTTRYYYVDKKEKAYAWYQFDQR
nr:MAG TPA: hypothetical protein [Caudoviricetes sp.]